MPAQSPLRLIKHWRRYAKRSAISEVPRTTRGVYVLYKQRGEKRYDVNYIGVAGLSVGSKAGIASRLKSHKKGKAEWTHFSVFEVHDNVTKEEIRELEALLLGIFCDDARVRLVNMQLGSSGLRKTRVDAAWRTRQRH